MTDKLKELQYAAQECKEIFGLPHRWYDFDTLTITYGIRHTDAMLITAASPDVVLALIKRAEDAEQLQRDFTYMKQQRDTLRAEVEQLNEDAEKMRKGFFDTSEANAELRARLNAMEGQLKALSKCKASDPSAKKQWCKEQHGRWMTMVVPGDLYRSIFAPGAAPKGEQA